MMEFIVPIFRTCFSVLDDVTRAKLGDIKIEADDAPQLMR